MTTLATEMAWLLREKYHGQSSPLYEQDCARLRAGEPLAYVIGFIPFLSATIWLDSKPLIPRVETEFWVAECLKKSAVLTRPLPRVLDLCAGSGCIGVALAINTPVAQVTFIEIDPAHESTIQKNCRQNGLSAGQFLTLTGDLFSPLAPGTTFDLIVANPPYIDQTLNRTDASVVSHEPHGALFSEENGLQHLAAIITAAPPYLTPGGELWIEHEPEQAAAISALATPNFTVNIHRDQYGVLRFTQLVLQ